MSRGQALTLHSTAARGSARLPGFSADHRSTSRMRSATLRPKVHDAALARSPAPVAACNRPWWARSERVIRLAASLSTPGEAAAPHDVSMRAECSLAGDNVPRGETPSDGRILPIRCRNRAAGLSSRYADKALFCGPFDGIGGGLWRAGTLQSIIISRISVSGHQTAPHFEGESK